MSDFSVFDEIYQWSLTETKPKRRVLYKLSFEKEQIKSVRK